MFTSLFHGFIVQGFLCPWVQVNWRLRSHTCHGACDMAGMFILLAGHFSTSSGCNLIWGTDLFENVPAGAHITSRFYWQKRGLLHTPRRPFISAILPSGTVVPVVYLRSQLIKSWHHDRWSPIDFLLQRNDSSQSQSSLYWGYFLSNMILWRSAFTWTLYFQNIRGKLQ